MTVQNLIDKKDYDYISWRITLPEDCGGGDTFLGCCESKSGELISLDGDTYNENEEVLSYEEWSDAEQGIQNGLTIVTKTEWYSAKDFDK